MKRFHVHVGVADLGKNIGFYSSLFGQPPAVVKDDYAKWMLNDPRINFAISSRGLPDGVDHLGFQTDTQDELSALRTQTAQANIEKREDGLTACCYAQSDKYWITDPQGIAWETFHTLNDIPTFAGGSEDRATGSNVASTVAGSTGSTTAAAPVCCAPDAAKKLSAIPVKSAASACC